MFGSEIEITGTKEELQAYFNALEPESEFRTERAGYKLKLSDKKLTITIEAEDATAFRAVTTSLLGLISIVDKSLKARR